MTFQISLNPDIAWSVNPNIQNNISKLVAPSPFGTNYTEIKKRVESEECENIKNWENIRKSRITVSRLAYFLVSHCEQMFTEYWNIVKKGHHGN